MTRVLPVPKSPDPPPLVDPYRNRPAYIQVLSELCHAEIAALHWFERISDPSVVDRAEIFVRASQMLVRDEAAHIADIEEIIGWLGGDGVLPKSESTRGFWELVDVRNASSWGGSLPLRASVVAIFVLLSEGLGYAFLHRLAHATVDERIREKLLSNVRDEERHARVSMSLLRRTLETEPWFWVDLSVYLPTYLMAARKAGRDQRKTLADIGLDYFEVTGSCFRFVGELFLEVFRDSAAVPPTVLPFYERLAEGLYSETGTRAIHAAMYVPEIPAMWWKVRAYSRLRRDFGWGRQDVRGVRSPKVTRSTKS